MLKEKPRNSQRQMMAETELILKPILPNGILQNRNLIKVGVASTVTTVAAVHQLISPFHGNPWKYGNGERFYKRGGTSRFQETSLQNIAMTATSAKMMKQPENNYFNRLKRPLQEHVRRDKMETSFANQPVTSTGERNRERKEKNVFGPQAKRFPLNRALSLDKVYKKTSPNGKLTTYLGKRDYYDHESWQDSIDGVCLVDPEYVKTRKVFGIVVVAFRYGREDMDVMGVCFRKDFAVKQIQIFPPLDENRAPLTKLQAKLLNKLGESAVPFHFDLPTNTPDTVYIQPSEFDGGQPCGVDYQITTYVAQSMDDKIHKRNSISLSIRKLSYFEQRKELPQPREELTKEFKFTSGAMKLECTLDKDQYFSGETINVNICVDNPTSKKAKRIKIQIWQYADITLYETVTYKSVVTELESEEGFPIEPNTSGFCQVYKLRPVLDVVKRRAGLALNGKHKYQDTTLATTTELSKVDRENLGVVISYKVRVKMTLGFGSGDMVLEVPFRICPAKLKGTQAEPEAKADDDTGEEYDLVIDEFKRVPVKGLENEESEGVSSMGV